MEKSDEIWCLIRNGDVSMVERPQDERITAQSNERVRLWWRSFISGIADIIISPPEGTQYDSNYSCPTGPSSPDFHAIYSFNRTELPYSS